MTLLTHEQAIKHVCPHIQYTQNESCVVQNEQQPIVVHQSCQGSACGMAWRWFDPEFRFLTHYRNGDGTIARVSDMIHGNVDVHVERTAVDLKERRGYCGIAGKPMEE